MKRIFLPILLLSLTWVSTPGAMAQQAADVPDTEVADDDDDEDDDDPDDEGVRLNPEFEFDISDGSDIDIPVPSFVKRNLNHINLNGADWTRLRKAFANAGTNPVSIVNIGDSHIQADYNTATTRELLQYDFGSAGRGLVTPLKLAGTNQPLNYVFTSPTKWAPTKLMSRQWNYPMGFTGVSLHPMNQEASFTVGTVESDDYEPFNSLTIFHGGKLTIDKVVDNQGIPVHFRAIPSRDYTQILLASQQTKVTVYFTSRGDLTLYGVSLEGNRPGLYYHAIGNNGATYATYNRIGNVGAGIAPLSPDLVIVSLGTNEAFGRFDAGAFYTSIDRLVKNIQAANPNAEVLLVTPMECQKSVSRTVTKKVKTKGHRRKGKRGRRSRGGTRTVRQSVKSYAPNAKVKEVRDEILRYGRDNKVAVLDWWDVAGGSGASSQWISANLFSKDRVHHSVKGYRLQGRLLYDAIIEAIVNPD